MDNIRRTQLVKSAVPFLASLLGCSLDDAWMLPVTFQMFDDAKPGGVSRKELTRVLHGSLEDHAEEMERLNQAGAGIFINVNPTDLKGRKKGNIPALRAWWADLDAKDATAPFEVQTILDSLPLETTITVRTPGGLHLYWLAQESMPCPDESRRDEHEADLKAIQQTLRPFGADPRVCNVCGVLRVPGYLHQKADPRMVELLKANCIRYERDQVHHAFPLPVVAPARPAVSSALPLCPVIRPAVLERAGAYLDTLSPAIQGQGRERGDLQRRSEDHGWLRPDRG